MTIKSDKLGFLEYCVALLWLICVNISAIDEYDQFPSLDIYGGKAWDIALLFLITAMLSMALLGKSADLRATWLKVWSTNRWIGLFLLWAVASVFWTVDLRATVYELILLICTTLIVSFVALRLQFDELLGMLTGVSAIAVLVSLGLVFIFPEIFIMWGPGHYGSWRGLFWHRNHAGIMMAFFNMIFLFSLLQNKILPSPSREHFGRGRNLLYLLLYALSAIHVFGSNSATGKIVFFVLNLFLLAAVAWLKWRSKLLRWHYYLFLFLVVGGLIIGGLNIEAFFKLLGRDPNMTGRTMMWPDLIEKTFSESPIWGHGFGAIWMRESFRIEIARRWGWGYQPYFADDGFIDLMLNLGAVGLAIFIYGFVLAVWRTGRSFIRGRSWKDLLYAGFLLFIFMANIAYSFLFEVEYFTWSLLIVTVFVKAEIADPAP